MRGFERLVNGAIGAVEMQVVAVNEKSEIVWLDS